MVAAVEILADQPEIVALAQVASVPASKMVAAFNDPQHFFDHMTLDELQRLDSACVRMADVQKQMAQALAIYADWAKAFLAQSPVLDS